MNGLRSELTEWVSSKSISSSGFMPKPADLQQSSNTVFMSAENFDPFRPLLIYVQVILIIYVQVILIIYVFEP